MFFCGHGPVLPRRLAIINVSTYIELHIFSSTPPNTYYIQMALVVYRSVV